MPMHDWTEVEAGIFHAFHHEWISEIGRAMNQGLLPQGYYALPEQVAAGFGPDVLTLQETRPTTKFFAETEAEFYRKKKSSIVVRHVSGDRIVAMIEIVSPGNKSSRGPMQVFVNKACELLEHRIHLLILDPFPPGPRDPEGVHGLIWQEMHSVPFHLPPDKPLTFVAYECDLTTRAYIEPLAVGDMLPNMPLFLRPNGCLHIPLEATYHTAFAEIPRRWRDVLQPPAVAPPSTQAHKLAAEYP